MAPAAKTKFPYPEDWDPAAEGYLSETEEVKSSFEKPKFPDTLLVLNLPKVAKGGEGEDKYAKLQKAIKKKLGKDDSDPGFELEMNINPKTNETDGCAFLKFPSKTAMEKGKARIDNFKFGANVHTATFYLRRNLVR